MSFLWLGIDDQPGPDSLRAVIERNAIALLSNHERAAVDPPSPGWLGHSSDRPLVRRSGLWNQRHVEEAYDPTFLDVFQKIIEQNGQNSDPLPQSLAALFVTLGARAGQRSQAFTLATIMSGLLLLSRKFGR